MNSAEKHYKVLGLQPDASLSEIKQAYKDLVAVWHPDRFTNNPRLQEKAQEKLKEINASYEYLRTCDPDDQPRLTEISIVPQSVQLSLGESQVFRLEGLDQNRKPMNIGYVEWRTTGGMIFPDGLFLAGCDGYFSVTASIGELNDSAYVTVVKPHPQEVKANPKSEIGEKEHPKTTDCQESKKNSVVPFVRVTLWILWGLLVLTPLKQQPQPAILVLDTPITVFCLSALLVGLISPKLVLIFGFTRNRSTVTCLYLPPIFVDTFFPFFPLYWIALIVVETSIWVAADATRIGVKKGQLGGGFLDRGRGGWFAFCLFFWIVGFPCYLLKRTEYIKRNQVSSAERP